MTSIFLREPTYITVQQVKDSTQKPAIALLSDDDIKELICKTEDSIDTYIWSYWTKFNETQSLIFPVDVDGVSTIPRDITVATLYTLEQIYISWDIISSANTSWGDVVQEKTWDRTIVYSEGTTSDNTLQIMWIPTQAMVLLKKYKQLFFKQVV